MAVYKEITCSSALTNVKGKFPFRWDMNIYRGCVHGCKYCFAMYSHSYLGDENGYFNDIYVKTNIVEKLEEQLRKASWKKEVINIGGVTDSYQPAEKHYNIMPDILKLMIKYKNPCIISTKSDLILRDFEIIEKLADITYVNIAATITCANENMRQKLEPKGAESIKRFEMLKEFSKTKAHTGVHFMPIIPFITDSRENIMGIYEGAKWCNAEYVLPALLNLRGKTREVFLDFMNAEFSDKLYNFIEFYKNKDFKNKYRKCIYATVREAEIKYSISSDYMKFYHKKPDNNEAIQLSLFD